MTDEQLELAQIAFNKWLRVVDADLAESERQFEEFTKRGQARDLQGAGQALADAEAALRRARAEVLSGIANYRNAASHD